MKKIFVIVCIIILSFLCIKYYPKKDMISITNEIEKRNFNIKYQEELGGEYKPWDKDNIPTIKENRVLLDLEKSVCINKNDEEVPNALIRRKTDVYLTTTQEVHCTLYFMYVELAKPIVDVSLTDDTRLKVSITLDQYAEMNSYCISKREDTCDGDWIDTKDTSFVTSEVDVGIPYYVFVKDSFDNIGISDEIGYLSGIDFTYTGNFVLTSAEVDSVRTGLLTPKTGYYSTNDEDWMVYFLSDGDLTVYRVGTDVDFWLLGGGGGGGNGYEYGNNDGYNNYTRFSGSGGGGGGYVSLVTAHKLQISKKDPNDLANKFKYTITIGAGGAISQKGGTTSITKPNEANALASADGGNPGGNAGSKNSPGGGGSGGANGGRGGYPQSMSNNSIYAASGDAGNAEFGTGTIRGGGGGGGSGGTNYGWNNWGGNQSSSQQSYTSSGKGGYGGWYGHEAEAGWDYYGGGGGGRGGSCCSGAKGGKGILIMRKHK